MMIVTGRQIALCQLGERHTAYNDAKIVIQLTTSRAPMTNAELEGVETGLHSHVRSCEGCMLRSEA